MANGIVNGQITLDQIREKTYFPMLIGGEKVESVSGEWMDVYYPGDGQLLAKVPSGNNQDVELAVENGLDAFQSWKKAPPMQRSRLLLKLADLLEEEIEYLAFIDSIDSGNPVTAMKEDIYKAARQIRYYAGLAMEMKGDTLPYNGTVMNATIREPYGVVARMIPFNHPLMFAAGKIAAPLAAGNTVILKPADQTPISPLIFGELANRVLPPGVLNIVTGTGMAVGESIVKHPKIKRIAFTGGISTGRKVLQSAAQQMKVVSLELGGKNPMLVFPDVDIKEVVRSAIKGMNFNVCQGQSCGSTARIYVHSSIFDRFLSELIEGVKEIEVGIPFDPACKMGALISHEHLEKVHGFVQRAIEQGAEIVLGGERVVASPYKNGYFYPPTIFKNVTQGMEIAKEEVFGPVISVLSWDSEDELLAFCNDSEYGLTASIWTNDIRKAYRFANEIESGYIWINESSARYVGTPFGGYKESGIGVENSIEEMFSYTQIKTINVSL
ncbi:aldehyde dehydrogenase family protein [Halalkalibacterium ligniniphilum]|uniref:aldehyde dehydrogenase family protein n=1 Tax=Halalkalibacterium ligniniphilum TaxID=1134413 RepID=UPI0003496C6B|nr:aldehyde dehydrogenase family protein [Halalkalibacterium ligniniphilum]